MRNVSRAGLLFTALVTSLAAAHDVAGGDAAYVAASEGENIFPFMYLGAKHMVTGVDHLLFLAGVVFFLHRLRDVVIYVTLFALGHSATLLVGVLSGISANARIIDAIIGLSVAYKAFENLGGFRHVGWQIDMRMAVLGFGLAHGFGLATKLQELPLSPAGLLANLVSFNVGVELGQFAALGVILLALNTWRSSRHFATGAWIANVLMLAAGFVLVGHQLAGYWLGV